MKAIVDADTCIGCGLCEQHCPAVFKVNDENVAEVVTTSVPQDATDDCRRAAEACPVDAITIEE